MAEDSKAEYSSTLQKFNSEQHDHYYTHIPNIFQVKLTGTVLEKFRIS